MDKKEYIRIVVAGDLNPSEGNMELFEKGDSQRLFGREVCQLFEKADYSIVNLEGPLTDSSIPQLKDGPHIKAPISSFPGIRNLGVKCVALANNHITDYSQRGCIDTLGVLDSSGISHVGLVMGGAKNNAASISLKLQGKHICIYNVSETFFCKPKSGEYGANVYDEWLVCNQLIEMKKTHDFIIVIYHGGAEYLQYPTPQTRERFHRMADCGANFIVSQHTHCIGCEEWYNGSYLLHGQGNFLFARQKMNPHLTKQGLVTELLIDVNDKGFEIKNHVVNIVNHVIKYDSRQDLTKFVERGKRIDDKEFIISEYQKLKVEEIMQKYLLSAKGDYPLRRITNRLFPKFKKNLGKSYTEQQILSNLRLLQDERRREDMYYVWHYLLDNINER